MPKLSEEVDAALEFTKSNKMLLGEFVETLSINGHMLPVAVLALASLIPIPIPGFGMIFGVVIALLGGAMFLGVKPWIPKRISEIAISEAFSRKLLTGISKYSKSVEKVFMPRLLAISRHPWNYQFNGLVITLCGFILALPLPPGPGSVVSINLLVLTLGDIEDDGYLILLGYALFIINLLVAINLARSGIELINNYF